MNFTKNDTFIAKATAVHGGKYDYSKVNYNNAKTKITIVCNEHGDFQQTPSNHLSGFNCQKCANNGRMTTEQYVKRTIVVHENKYDYSKVNYINADTKITIICKEHGEFRQIPDFHLNRKCGCPKCANNITLTNNEFIDKARKIHGDKYDYSQVSYINNRTKIIIICREHGEFSQKQFSHLLGVGCPHCINKTEYKFLEILKTRYPTVQRQFKAEWCKQKRCLPFDFVIEEHKVIIELDGPQHFKQVANWRSPELQQQQDLFKTKCANENGYSIIRVLQTDVANDLLDLSTFWEKIESKSTFIHKL